MSVQEILSVVVLTTIVAGAFALIKIVLARRSEAQERKRQWVVMRKVMAREFTEALLEILAKAGAAEQKTDELSEALASSLVQLDYLRGKHGTRMLDDEASLIEHCATAIRQVISANGLPVRIDELSGTVSNALNHFEEMLEDA